MPLLLAGLLAVIVALPAPAQIYSVDVRPEGISYRVARTDNFDLIYQVGFEREAARTGVILESSLSRARQLTGTTRRLRIPVVLNAFDDRSNGFVTPFPFKMEIEIPSLKGNRLSPRHASWLHAVGPHELVHAVHAESGRGIGTIGLLRLFSPDLSRSLNLLVPPGIAEGVAVFLESEGEGRPGRLNHSLFQMEFRAAMASDDAWSLAQMLESPTYSIPGDRFYHGGAYLYTYLYEQDGGEAFRRAQRVHYRFPFFGYGLSLWVGTRRPPWKLGSEFRRQARQDEIERQTRLGKVTTPRVVSSAKGLIHRRPQWLNDSEIAAYVWGYHTVPGFYRVQTRSGGLKRISAEGITEDALFTVSADRSVLLFSRYLRNPLVETQRVAEAFALDVESGESVRLTKQGHVFTVTKSHTGQVWGSVDSGAYSLPCRIGEKIEYPPIPLPPRTNIKALAWSPATDSLAALVNREGVQGIHLVSFDGNAWSAVPVLTPEAGSILDFSWLPDGSGILFTSDHSGVANLHLLLLEQDRVLRVTNARYGAFEGAVSPDGSRVAYIDYQHERWNLVMMDFDPANAVEVDRDLFRAPVRPAVHAPVHAPVSPAVPASDLPELSDADSSLSLNSRPYRPIRYLAPRGVFPLLTYTEVSAGPDDVDLGVGVGVAVASADPLQRWSYVAAGWYQADKLWGRFSLRTGTSVIRPRVGAFRTPSTRIVSTPAGIRRVGREEEGIEFGAALPITLSSNIYGSSVTFGLAGQYSRSRFFDRSGSAITEFQQRATVAPGALAQIGTHANRRDLRIRRGIVIGATALHDVWSTTSSRTAVLVDARLFAPSVPGSGGSFSLVAGYLWQNQAAIYDLDFFLPRGLEDSFVASGGHIKYGIDVVQPVAFVDDGLFVLPFYVHSLYVFGFAESVRPAANLSFGIDSVGGGAGVQLRLFYQVNVDLRVGVAYLPDRNEVESVFR